MHARLGLALGLCSLTQKPSPSRFLVGGTNVPTRLQVEEVAGDETMMGPGPCITRTLCMQRLMTLLCPA